jgi:hypothetical protein
MSQPYGAQLSGFDGGVGRIARAGVGGPMLSLSLSNRFERDTRE